MSANPTSATLQVGRLAAAAFHLLASIAVAAVGALLIFRLWYPSPYNHIAGGAMLFLLLVAVDVVLGPALTLVAASPGKRLREFRIDLAVIVVLQLAAFSYGIYTIALARPVFTSFEIDRFRVVTAADIESEELAKAPPELRSLPWLGPKLIAAAKPTDPAEQLRSMELGLAGIDLSMLPGNWRPFDGQQAWRAARPVSALLARYPTSEAELARIAREEGKPMVDLRFLPLVSRQVSWVVVLAPTDAHVAGYLPVDGFF